MPLSSSGALSESGGSLQRGELIAKIGTVVSAIVASSCCWLPVLLLAVGVSGVGIASALEAYRPIFMVVTFGFLAMAFYFTYRPRRGTSAAADCCSPQSAKMAGSPKTAQADCCASSVGTGRVSAISFRQPRLNMMALNKVMLWAVTILAVVFLFAPQYVTGLLGVGSEEVTSGMTRSVVKVEGMTCKG